MPAPIIGAGVSIAIGTLTGAIADAIGSVFDDTTNEICKCLKVIDRTLIDGFAGRDIESERLKEALDVVKADYFK